MKKRILSLSAALVLSASAVVSYPAYAESRSVYDDVYTGDYRFERHSFSELLEMTDEEFIELDSYIGDIPEDDRGSWLMYRCIYDIITGSGRFIGNYKEQLPHTEKNCWDIGTEKTYYTYSGSTDEEYEEFLGEINSISGTENFSKHDGLYTVFVLDKHDSTVIDDCDTLYGIMSLRPTFYLDFSMIEQVGSFDKDSFSAEMEEVFGDSIGYDIRYTAGDRGVFVDFNIPERTEINQENILYHSKLLYALTSIDPYFSYGREYWVSSAEPSEVKGDANCDFSVDMADVVLIMQAMANPDKYGINGTAENHLTSQGGEKRRHERRRTDCGRCSVYTGSSAWNRLNLSYIKAPH